MCCMLPEFYFFWMIYIYVIGLKKGKKKKKKLSLPLQKQQSFKCEKYKTTYIAAIAGTVSNNQSSMNHGKPRGQQSYLNIEITEAKNKSDQIGEYPSPIKLRVRLQ